MPAQADLDKAAKRRDDVLASIATSISERGYPPSISELARETGVSTLTTRRDLDSLVTQGKIERDAKVDRGIRLLTP
jgi:DeoR/GlpR family transcriptional regulator of sugar metabolism